MKLLRQKIDQNKLLQLHFLSKLHVYKERFRLSVMPDYDVSKYDGPVDKEYFLKEEISLSDSYQYLFNVNLQDFGYLINGDKELYKEKDDSGIGRLSYQIDQIDLRERLIRLKGSLFGSGFDIGSDGVETVADLEIIGLKSTDSKNLKLYEELLLEGYLLELEKTYRMAFFSYFTAIEAFVSEALEPIKANLFSELHEPIENLSLDLKVRILAKEVFKTEDFNKIKIWGAFSGLLRSLKDKRNKIAHGKSNEIIDRDIVNDCFMCVVILVGFSNFGKSDFREISRLFYPK